MNRYDWQVESTKEFMKHKELLVEAATGCLSGETLIDLPRDLSKYPGGVPIRELVGKKDFYVYTFNTDTSCIELKKCKEVWLSGKDKDVYEIKTKSGRTILATEEHPFLTDVRKDGNIAEHTAQRKYIKLSNLKVGDFLTVFNRSKWINPKNYNLLRIDYNNFSRNRREWGKIEEHKFIMQQLHVCVSDTEIIHHIDHNKNNNSIDNLEVLDAREHNRNHIIERGLFGKAIWPNGEHPKGFLNHKHSIESKRDISNHVRDTFSGINYVPERVHLSSLPIQSFMMFKTDEHAKKSGILSSIALRGMDKDEISKRSSNNGQIKYFDKIVSIEYHGKIDVYNMEVEDNHNFIANGMIVHNCGKTVMATDCLTEVLTLNPDYNVLIVTPKIVILETVWIPELLRAGYGPEKVGGYYSEYHEFSKITLTTIASITKLDLSMFDMIICDEIHNMLSPNLIKLLKKPFKYKLGLSASIKRRDQMHWKLLAYFNYHNYEYGIKQAIADGIINKFNFKMIGVEITDPAVRLEYDMIDADYRNILRANGGWEKINRLPAGDPIKTAALNLLNKRSDLVNNYIRKVDVVQDIVLKNPEKKIILFSQYNKITRNIYWALKEISIRSEVINSDVKQKYREQFLKEFENDSYKVLLSSRIFEEGYNLPKIDCAIFLSSNSSSRQMIQRLGRILRKKDIISEAFYIYCKDTFEQEYSEAAKEFVEDIAENLVEVTV